MPNSWKIAGSYFEACSCDLACPCVFLSPPTSGDCTVLLAWHIDQGRFGEVNLDGLNAVLAAHAPGHMLEVKWKVALYVDEQRQFMRAVSGRDVCARLDGVPDGDGLRTRRIGSRLW